MNPYPAANGPGMPTWGSLALVTYLPNPLGVFLSRMRYLPSGETLPDAHITLLPPRPLALELEIAAREISQQLSGVRPFEIELGSVRVFPETGMLYLSVEAGSQELLRLHDLLNRGKLFSSEHFEYVPHLTLSGPIASSERDAILEEARDAWKSANIPPRFLVEETVLLWQPGDCSENEWSRISAHPIGTSSPPASLYSNIGI